MMTGKYGYALLEYPLLVPTTSSCATYTGIPLVSSRASTTKQVNKVTTNESLQCINPRAA